MCFSHFCIPIYIIDFDPSLNSLRKSQKIGGGRVGQRHKPLEKYIKTGPGRGYKIINAAARIAALAIYVFVYLLWNAFVWTTISLLFARPLFLTSTPDLYIPFQVVSGCRNISVVGKRKRMYLRFGMHASSGGSHGLTFNHELERERREISPIRNSSEYYCRVIYKNKHYF